MANFEESSPLLPKQDQELETTKDETNPPAPLPVAVPIGWTADGLPVGELTMQRAQWDSGIFACLGRNDEFCSSDLEVCFLGSMAPCVLCGSNVERLGSAPGTFSNHCLPYTALYLIGNSFFGWNCLAPWFSYSIRTAIRRKFNLEAEERVSRVVIGRALIRTFGSCEALTRSCGCCRSFVEGEVQREQCETACDFATHVFCHACAICQEGREVRRRLHHPGFNTQPILVTIPPGGQTMGRGGA